jgi:flagellar biogenesis protein FliO
LLWPKYAPVSISYRRASAAACSSTFSSWVFWTAAETARQTSMFCLHRRVTLGLLAAAIATPLSAETTPGPPDWADAGASVYLGMKQSAPAAENRDVLQASTDDDSSAAATRPAAPAPRADSFVAPAIHQSPASSSTAPDGRRLSPPKRTTLPANSNEAGAQGKLRSAAPRPLVDFGMPPGSIYTVSSALAIVIGAFLLFAWVLRRGGQKTSAPLPADVVSVLGRVPLAARQFAELLRVGNKLVLVSLTPSGAETLTEVTDPVEVDRLVGLCQQYSPHSTTKAFEQVFRQLSRESAPDGFAGSESLPQLSSAAAYRAHRGDTARG